MPAQQQPLTAQHLLIRDAAGDIGWSLMTENMLSITTTAVTPTAADNGDLASLDRRHAEHAAAHSAPRRHDHTTTAATLAPASRHCCQRDKRHPMGPAGSLGSHGIGFYRAPSLSP